jgi:protein-L-isoaspartate O-methyltransferase
MSQFNVFEYGSGNSTLWWSKRAEKVTSVEDDEAWYEKIKHALKTVKNVDYRLEVDRKRYYSMASNNFDIFIVDGKYRLQCLEHILSLDGEGLMIILDNADWYPKSVRYLQENLGWIQTDFHGFGPINNYTWSTSIFVNPARHNELRYGKALRSQCSLIQEVDGDC